MTRSKWMHVGEILKMNALNYPDKLGWQDKNREFTLYVTIGYGRWKNRNGTPLLKGFFKEMFEIQTCFHKN